MVDEKKQKYYKKHNAYSELMKKGVFIDIFQLTDLYIIIN